MNICRRALGIALRHPLYLIIYIGFLSAMGVALMSEVGGDGSANAQGPAAQTRIALIDRDQSKVSRAIEHALGASDELIDVADEQAALQDALATDRVDAVVIVPEGFGAELIAAARAGGEMPELESASGGDMQAAALGSQRAGRLASLIATEAALEPNQSEQDVCEAVAASLDAAADIEVLQGAEGSTAASRLSFYLTFSSYTVTSSIVVVAGVVLAAINAPDVRRRQLASPVSSLRLGLGSMGACAVLTLAICLWVAGVGIVTSGADELLSLAVPQVIAAVAALVVFALVPLSLAYALAQCGFKEESLNAIANLGGMVMSFLGGAWVPLSLMGAEVQAVARFTPTYWMYDAVTRALGASAWTPQVAGVYAVDLAVIALFAGAILSAGLVAARVRVRER